MAKTNILLEATTTYQPKAGGIHPQEATQHHATHIASVIRQVTRSAGDTPIDGIAFSRPGGPNDEFTVSWS